MKIKFMRRTICKNFYTADIKPAIVCANDRFCCITPVGLGLVEIGHPVDADLHWYMS